MSGVALAGGVGAGFWGAGLIEYMGSAPDTPWRALTAEEAATLDRFAEELIPADPPEPWNGMKGFPGAHEAKVIGMDPDALPCIEEDEKTGRKV